MTSTATSSTSSKIRIGKLLPQGWVMKNLRYLLFLSALGVAYIYHGHRADKLARKTTKIERSIKELEYEYKTLQSQVIFRSKASELMKVAESLRLTELTRPPVVLRADSAAAPGN